MRVCNNGQVELDKMVSATVVRYPSRERPMLASSKPLVISEVRAKEDISSEV